MGEGDPKTLRIHVRTSHRSCHLLWFSVSRILLQKRTGHIWFESNLVNFLFPKDLIIVLSSPEWALSDPTMESVENKNVPTCGSFCVIDINIVYYSTYSNLEILGVMVNSLACHAGVPGSNPTKVTSCLYFYWNFWKSTFLARTFSKPVLE